MAYSKREFLGGEFGSQELSGRWDKIARNILDAGWERPTVTDKHFSEVISNFLNRWIAVKCGCRVLKLDLFNEMTHTPHLEWFSDRNAQTFGIDISKVVVLNAKKKFRGTPFFINGDIRELPFKDDSFDIVFSIGTLEHLRTQENAVFEVRRVLKHGGTAVIGVNNRNSMWLSPVLWETVEFLGICRRYCSYEPSLSPKDLEILLTKAGFTDIRLDGTYLYPKILRLFDVWSEIKCNNRATILKKAKMAVYSPTTKFFEALESWGGVNLFADMIMAIAKKPLA